MTIDAILLKPQTIPLPNDPSIPNPVPTTFGVVYTFQQAGVVLTEHTHTDTNAHITIVISGSLTATVAGVDRTIYAGDIINLGTETHSFVSLEPATIVNIIKLGVTTESIGEIAAKANATLDAVAAKLANIKAALGAN